MVVQPAPLPQWLYPLCYRWHHERAKSSLGPAWHWGTLVPTEYQWWPWGMSVNSNPIVRLVSPPLPFLVCWEAKDREDQGILVLLKLRSSSNQGSLQWVCSPPLLSQLEQHKKAVEQTGGPCTCALMPLVHICKHCVLAELAAMSYRFLAFFSHAEKMKAMECQQAFQVPVFLWLWALLLIRIKIDKMDILSMMKNKSEKDIKHLCGMFWRPQGHLTDFERQKSNLVHFSLFLPTLKRLFCGHHSFFFLFYCWINSRTYFLFLKLCFQKVIFFYYCNKRTYHSAALLPCSAFIGMHCHNMP